MIRLVCVHCQEPFVLLERKPLPGEQLHKCNPVFLNPYLPSITPATPIECPECGRVPFHLHNVGVQAMTDEGEMIPDDSEVFG